MPGDSLKVVATPDLYNLTMKWATEYNRLFPGVNIKIINAAGQKRAGDLIKDGSIGFVSSESYPELKDGSLWKVIVGRDVVVPVINAKNPFLEEINKHGISPEVLSLFVKNGDYRNWGDLLKNNEKQKVDYYCLNDKAALKNLSDFLKTDETRITGMNTGSSAEIVSAVQKDPYAIGFCKLVNVLDFENQAIVENIRLLPIDRNGNGAIDYNEKIYDDINSFSRGVWIGKYPKALFSNIYSIAKVQPEDVNDVAFIKWVLNDGQKYVSANGYSDLLVSERENASDKLYNARLYAGASAGEKNLLKTLMFVIATVILIGLITNAIARQRKRKKAAVKITGSAQFIQFLMKTL